MKEVTWVYSITAIREGIVALTVGYISRSTSDSPFYTKQQALDIAMSACLSTYSSEQGYYSHKGIVMSVATNEVFTF